METPQIETKIQDHPKKKNSDLQRETQKGGESSAYKQSPGGDDSA